MKHPFKLTLLFVLIPMVVGLAQTTKTMVANNPPADSLNAWYRAAVTNAQNPEPEEISTELMGVNPTSTALQYKTIDGQVYVKALSWMSFSDTTYYPREKWNHYETGSYRMWVTLVPQLQVACQDANYVGGLPLTLRLEMALGLPPNNGKQVFMEVWIRPQDLYRPCPDPSPYDNACGLSIPEYVTEDYRTWFNDLRGVQYYQKNGNTGYPWTQLGYTFDWNPSNTTHVGFSEYVVRPNSVLVIDGFTPTAEYCGL